MESWKILNNSGAHLSHSGIQITCFLYRIKYYYIKFFTF